jgi:hypothetical protein
MAALALPAVYQSGLAERESASGVVAAMSVAARTSIYDRARQWTGREEGLVSSLISWDEDGHAAPTSSPTGFTLHNVKCSNLGPVWYSFMSSFTTSIAKQLTLWSTLCLASLKTHSHRVKHMVKLQKHGSLLRS